VVQRKRGSMKRRAPCAVGVRSPSGSHPPGRRGTAADAGSTEHTTGTIARVAAGVARRYARLSGRNDLADDLHQQAWVACLEAAGRFDAGRGVDLGAWLNFIASRHICDYLSHDRAVCSRADREVLHTGTYCDIDELADATPDPEADAIRRCDDETVRRAVRRALAAIDGSVTAARVLCGEHPGDVATAAGLPVRAVYLERDRVVRRLRRDRGLRAAWADTQE